MSSIVTAVARSAAHSFSKPVVPAIMLLKGLGVEGDAHLARRSSTDPASADPTQPNLRQVHLIHGELHDELQLAGFNVAEGTMGENITTRGIDLLGLPRGARLHIGADASWRSPACAILARSWTTTSKA